MEETLVSRIERLEGEKGPFEIRKKGSAYLHYCGLGFLTPILKLWEKEACVRDLNGLRDYANIYFGRVWDLAGTRRTLFKNGRIYKLRSISDPDSEAARYGLPPDHIWLKVEPDPEA